jgi:nucleotidyltransferase/DNA polymerase involved in DNA repair
LALKVKRDLREQVGECLTCSIGIAPNVFLGKVGSDLQKPELMPARSLDAEKCPHRRAAHGKPKYFCKP